MRSLIADPSCTQTVRLGTETLRCNRPLVNRHYQHAFRKQGNGYRITITWTTKPAALVSPWRLCGKCKQPGHNRRKHDREAA